MRNFHAACGLGTAGSGELLEAAAWQVDRIENIWPTKSWGPFSFGDRQRLNDGGAVSPKNGTVVKQ